MSTTTEKESVRTEISNIIAAIKPYDTCEQEHIDFTKTWIASGAEIFRIEPPDRPDIHLVSYFILIDKEADGFLLVDHKRARLWLPPGGHVEIDEHPKDTVIREAKEELGIDADFLFQDPLFLTKTKTHGNKSVHTDISLWYVLNGRCEDTFAFDDKEFHSVRWFKENEIPFERADLHMRRFLSKFEAIVK